MGKLLVLAAGLVLVFVGSSAAADWHVATVDSAGVARYSSMKIDSDGNAHIAYVIDDGNRYPLQYGFWDHKLQRWFFMNVAQGASFSSLALDSKQRPHIAWADYGTLNGAKLRYAYWDGVSWVKEVIPLNSVVIGYYTSLILDANDKPTISFYEYRGAQDTDFRIRLRMVTWTGQYWRVRTLDGTEGSGKFNSMAIDPRGEIHVAYANVSAETAGMRYAHGDGETWQLEVVDDIARENGDNVGESNCIALDKLGQPHIAYMDFSHPALKYAVRKSGSWVIETVDVVSKVGYPDRNSIALDEQGRPYIGYYDAGNGILKVAHKEGDKWVIEIVDRNSSGATSSMQIDRGVLWISYADEANGGLKIARRQLDDEHVSETLPFVAPSVPPVRRAQ